MGKRAIHGLLWVGIQRSPFMTIQYKSEREAMAAIYDAALLLLEARRIPGIRISENAASELRSICDHICFHLPVPQSNRDSM